MSKSKGSTEAEEVRSGYLHKSPPGGQLKSMKSWTRRFFVLFKMSEDAYIVKYFKSEKKGKALGEIDVSGISLLVFCPENHSMWGWIHKNFRCPTACVLLLRATCRDYFLVGENRCEDGGSGKTGEGKRCASSHFAEHSWETDGWFNALYKILKSRPQMVSHEQDTAKPRTQSAPPAPQKEPYQTDLAGRFRSKTSPSLAADRDRVCQKGYPADVSGFLSEDTGPYVAEENIYAVPKSLLAPLQVPKNDEKEKGEKRTDGGLYEEMTGLHDTVIKTQDNTPSENHRLSTPIEIEVCVSQEDLKQHLNLTLGVETPSERDSLLLKGDEILAINDLHIGSVEEVEYYLSKLRRNKVTLTIRRLSSEFQAMNAELSSV